jgi:hypothetical protein
MAAARNTVEQTIRSLDEKSMNSPDMPETLNWALCDYQEGTLSGDEGLFIFLRGALR